jgi:hypothetical protein
MTTSFIHVDPMFSQKVSSDDDKAEYFLTAKVIVNSNDKASIIGPVVFTGALIDANQK